MTTGFKETKGDMEHTSTGIFNAKAAAVTTRPIRGMEFHHMTAYEAWPISTALEGVKRWLWRCANTS